MPIITNRISKALIKDTAITVVGVLVMNAIFSDTFSSKADEVHQWRFMIQMCVAIVISCAVYVIALEAGDFLGRNSQWYKRLFQKYSGFIFCGVVLLSFIMPPAIASTGIVLATGMFLFGWAIRTAEFLQRRKD